MVDDSIHIFSLSVEELSLQ